MVRLGLEPGAAGWQAQTNPLSYGSTPFRSLFSFEIWIGSRILLEAGRARYLT